jgi:hypothetical protein
VRGKKVITAGRKERRAPEKVSAARVRKRGGSLGEDRESAGSQLGELRNMRVLLEEARELTRDLSYHRRARLEAVIGRALEEVDRQIEDLRSDRRR